MSKSESLDLVLAFGRGVSDGSIPNHIARTFLEDPWQVARSQEIACVREVMLGKGDNETWEVLPNGHVVEHEDKALTIFNPHGKSNSFPGVEALLKRRDWSARLNFVRRLADNTLVIAQWPTETIKYSEPYTQIRELAAGVGLYLCSTDHAHGVFDILTDRMINAWGDTRAMCIGDSRLVYSPSRRRVIRVADDAAWSYEGTLLSAATAGNCLVAVLEQDGRTLLTKGKKHLAFPQEICSRQTMVHHHFDATSGTLVALSEPLGIVCGVDKDVYVVRRCALFPDTAAWEVRRINEKTVEFVMTTKQTIVFCQPFSIEETAEGYCLLGDKMMWKKVDWLCRLNGATIAELSTDERRMIAVAFPEGDTLSATGEWSAVDFTQLIHVGQKMIIPVQDPSSRRWYITDNNNVRYGKSYNDIRSLHQEGDTVVYWGRDGRAIYKVTAQIDI